MLTAKEVSKSFGDQQVLANVSLGLNEGDCIALVGSNGSGKSTFMRILAGEESFDEGTISHSKLDEVGYLPQTMRVISGETIDDVIASSSAGLRAIEQRMRVLEGEMANSNGADSELLAEYGELSHHFEARGGYELDSNIDRILDGLGVGYLKRSQAVVDLSGGESARVAFAALLLASPDILLLDEPTNDLDSNALTWLETYLREYKGAVLLISHDRDFIDALANAIVELDEHQHTFTRYEGNYGRYLTAKAAARVQAQQAYDLQQKEIADLREKAATTARSVGHSRARTDHDKTSYNFRGANVERAVSRNVRAAREKLDRIEGNLLLPPPDPLRFRANLTSGSLPKDAIAIEARDVNVSYGGRKILDRVRCEVNARDRICIVGENGTGKSTLLKILANELEPDSGEIQVRKEMKVGYLSQETRLPLPAETVAANITAGLRLRGLDEVPDESRGWLIQWGLILREDLRKRASELSTGQQRKVDLGILIASAPDVLMLDEPTNHLSFDVVESLQAALLSFAGPVVVVTHDRRLMRVLSNTWWRLIDGKLEVGEASKLVAT
ncbi:ribosomal protection-like ABC-F family protein [Mycobacterium shigaense]|uniref:ribosomal protection-like ABC-F family protein n=1 Tax=Mycobacterium shigaense TaxID=722731 RepID=UPI000E58A190|nr:ABC-F family ATP-binding cassette domain-containing protein [Mycobacterium shigaense]